MSHNAGAANEPKFCVRARFYSIRQTNGEPVTAWYDRVRAAAALCGFGVGRLELSVADKFVTGLWPGPVADRMFDEPADSRPEDLLAVAVAAERRASGRSGPGPDVRSDALLLNEVRETLKLYKFQNESHTAVRENDRDGGGGGDRRNDFNRLSSTPTYGSKTIVSNAKSTADENSRSKEKIKRDSEFGNTHSPLNNCKSCYDLATKLLQSFQVKNHTYYREFDKNKNSETREGPIGVNYGRHDESNCYCSLP